MPSTGSIGCLLVDEPLSAVLFKQILPFIRRKLCHRMPAGVFLGTIVVRRKNRWSLCERLTHVAEFLNAALTNNSANHLLFPTLTQPNVRNGNR